MNVKESDPASAFERISVPPTKVCLRVDKGLPVVYYYSTDCRTTTTGRRRGWQFVMHHSVNSHCKMILLWVYGGGWLVLETKVIVFGSRAYSGDIPLAETNECNKL